MVCHALAANAHRIYELLLLFHRLHRNLLSFTEKSHAEKSGFSRVRVTGFCCGSAGADILAKRRPRAAGSR
jgi:hypothetical protein